MFPLSDSIKAKRFPFLNLFVIFLTVFVFVEEVIAPDQAAFINRYALIPAKIHLSDRSTIATFFTAIFLHGGLLHILSNMWFLFIFGDNVETALSPLVYLLLYLLAGLAGNIVQYVLMPASTIPMLGSSGAIAGILGCYCVMFPRAKVKTLIFILFFVTIVDLAAPIILGYWFVLQILSGITSLPSISDQGGIAFFAHIAGFIVGVIFGMLFKERAKAANIVTPSLRA